MTIISVKTLPTKSTPGSVYKQDKSYFVYDGEQFVPVTIEAWTKKVVIPESLAHLPYTDSDELAMPIVVDSVVNVTQFSSSALIVGKKEPVYQLTHMVDDQPMTETCMILPSNPELSDLGESTHQKSLILRHLTAKAGATRRAVLYSASDAKSKYLASLVEEHESVTYLQFVQLFIPPPQEVTAPKEKKSVKKVEKSEKKKPKEDRVSSPESPKTNRLDVKALKTPPKTLKKTEVIADEDEGEEEEDEDAEIESENDSDEEAEEEEEEEEEEAEEEEEDAPTWWKP